MPKLRENWLIWPQNRLNLHDLVLKRGGAGPNRPIPGSAPDLYLSFVHVHTHTAGLSSYTSFNVDSRKMRIEVTANLKSYRLDNFFALSCQLVALMCQMIFVCMLAACFYAYAYASVPMFPHISRGEQYSSRGLLTQGRQLTMAAHIHKLHYIFHIFGTCFKLNFNQIFMSIWYLHGSVHSLPIPGLDTPLSHWPSLRRSDSMTQVLKSVNKS